MCLVKIRETMVKIRGIHFGRLLVLTVVSHVGHMQGLGVMDLIHLFKVEVGSMLL